MIAGIAIRDRREPAPEKRMGWADFRTASAAIASARAFSGTDQGSGKEDMPITPGFLAHRSAGDRSNRPASAVARIANPSWATCVPIVGDRRSSERMTGA